MKTPIKPSDIRKGDLIRWEDESTEYATEFRVSDPTHYVPRMEGSYYLLDRPEPAVDLPTEPTLGWVTSKYGGSALGTWERHEPTRGSLAGEVTALSREREAPLDVIRAFIPAVAIPKTALDELRQGDRCATFSDLLDAVRNFLAAVDAAQDGAR